tara:strand:+ start:775 stop:2433 length:1659 start_codon:yes stop_codon:yes gene_type:complete
LGSGFLALNMKKYFLILTSSILISCGEKVDLLVYNAKIYTANDTFDEATSFVVKDGVFIDVGSEGEDLNDRYNPDNVVDAHGLTIIPGLIDAHCHFLQFGLEAQQLNLRGTKSFDEILKKLVSYYNESNPKVIYGRYWDQNDWTIKEFPDKKEIDSIFPEVPVVLERVDGHAMLANQKALDIAGINLNTNLPGGTVKKKNGRLTGILIDSPKNLIINSLPKPTTDDKIKALMFAENKCFEYGLTTIDDAGLSKKDILLIDSLQQSDIIKMRIYAMISNNNDDINYFIKRGIYKTDKLNVRSVKVYADGALGSRGALLKEPYSDDPKNKGKYSTPYNSIDSLALKLSQTNFQMNTHAIGDAANHSILKIYNKVLKDKSDPRWRVEHSQIVSSEDFKLFNSKIIPSIQPAHATSDMYWADERLGYERLKDGGYAYKRLLDWSGTIALGTDFPVEKINPFYTFYSAVARKDLTGYPVSGFQKENSLSRYEALMGMTLWAAHANFEENEKGSIEVGKFADFVILDRNIMKVDERDIPTTKVVATILGGQIVYSNRF